MAAMLAFLVRMMFERRLADAYGRDVRASLVTRELAPGDNAVVRIDCFQDLDCLDGSISAQLVLPSGPLTPEPQPAWTTANADDQALLDVHIPDIVAPGPLILRLEVEMATKSEVNRSVSTAVSADRTQTDNLEIPLDVTNRRTRTLQRWMFRAFALVAWCAALTISYWAARRPLA